MRVLIWGVGAPVFALCVVSVAGYTVGTVGDGFGDFRGDLWHPAHLIRAGLSPFPGPHDPVTAATGVYAPPLVVTAGMPLSFLPYNVASVVWALILVGCALGTLWLVGVRDRRCYLVALLSEPFLASFGLGNPTPVVIVLVAAAYRLRESKVGSGLAIGAALAVKPIAAPLLLWRGGTRRAIIAVVSGLTITLAAWAVIGFRGLTSYPDVLSRLTSAQGGNGASVYAIFVNLGSSSRVATLAAVVAAAVVLIVGRRSFTSAILASLLFAPITWSIYFALLYIVVAIQSPRLSARWLVGLWYTPFVFKDHVGGARPLWMLVLAVGVAIYVCAVKPGAFSVAMQGREHGRSQTSVA
jgi:hypothetical protein